MILAVRRHPALPLCTAACYPESNVVKLSIDYEFASKVWWESGGQDLWEAIAEGAGNVVLDPGVAESWLAEAARLPGWSEGHEYAPHPINSSEPDEFD